MLFCFGSGAFYLHFNQGLVYFNYLDWGEKYDCLGRSRLEAGILDGLRIKKAVIGPIDDDELDSYGMKKERY